MPELQVPEELHAYLLSQNIGQVPNAAPSTGLPSLWLNPKDGSPQPRTGEDCTITVCNFQVADAPGLETYMEECFLDIVVRHRNSDAACRLTHRTIKGLLSPREDHVGRKHWTMNTLLVQYSTVWRAEQALPFVNDGDLKTYDRTASFRFGCFRSDLST